MTKLRKVIKFPLVIPFLVAILLFGTYQSFSTTITTGQNIMLAEIIEIIEEVDDNEELPSEDQDAINQPMVNYKHSFLIKTFTSRAKFKYLYSVFDIVIPPPELVS